MAESIGGFLGQLILTDALTYDDQGRVTGAIDSGGSNTMEYHGLGALKQSGRMSDPSSYFNNAGGTSVQLSAELYTVDALGFVKDTDRTGLGVDGSVSRPSVWRSVYDTTGTGRMEQRGPFGDPNTNEVYVYDDAGNRVLAQWINLSEQGVTASIYGADDKLRVTDRQNCSLEQDAGTGGLVCGLNEYGRMTTFEEYRYDALGRRVMVRAQSDKGLCPGNNCPNYIQRTVWDGDQVLLEIRRPGGATETDTDLANDHGVIDLRLWVWICNPNVDIADCFDDEPPGTPIEDLCVDADQAVIIPPGCIEVPAGPQDFFPYGVTAYIHGGELDRPLSIYRDDHSVEQNAMRIQPIANWKGDFVTGAFHDGTAADCMASAQPSCIDIQWPGERVWHGWENKDPELVQNGPRHWMGSLVYGSADASGLLYRRNRYYDPVAGQFTQEDPIGLAGGLNLYGFANGDPVNFSDPFGLMAGPDEIARWLSIKAALEFIKFHLTDRAAANGTPVSLQTALEEGRERIDPNTKVFHTIGAPGNRVFEFEGGQEYVYSNGQPVTGGPNIGTYNYCDSQENPACHVLLDAAPHVLVGTLRADDQTTLWQRLKLLFDATRKEDEGDPPRRGGDGGS